MAYSQDVASAEALARKCFVNAVDKAGAPYIGHCERVAGRLEEPEYKVIGWLHDVVEDTDITIDEIRRDFGADTADAVDAVTHRQDESWADYIERVKANPVAKAVKISDLIDNSNLSRLRDVRPKDVLRQRKYNRTLCYLMGIEAEL